MKTIGLIGGMSWESTATYYTLINQAVKHELGGLHSAKIVLVSVDFAQIEALQMQGEWQKAGEVLAQAAVSLQSAGADFFLICTNTMHKVASQVQASVSIPLLHIADATANALTEKGIRKVGLLGTAFTMEHDFYKARLSSGRDLEVLIPDASSRAVVHNVIYQELCLGNICHESKIAYVDIIDQLKATGAEAVIFGCTEIALLVSQQDVSLPVFDTTEIHARSAVTSALKAQ